jgi:hypothetical protein
MAQTGNRGQMSVSGAPGTGPITLNAAWDRHDDFEGAGITSGSKMSYLLEDEAMWEYGEGVYTNLAGVKTLTRATCIRSSSGTGTKINSTNTGGTSAKVSNVAIQHDQGPDFMSTFAQTVEYNYTLRDGYNGFSVGPITIASGFSVTIPSGSSWVII